MKWSRENMESKPRKKPDYITFIIVCLLSLAGSQACEGINWPIGYLLRGVFLGTAFFSSILALYLYDRTQKQ